MQRRYFTDIAQPTLADVLQWLRDARPALLGVGKDVTAACKHLVCANGSQYAIVLTTVSANKVLTSDAYILAYAKRCWAGVGGTLRYVSEDWMAASVSCVLPCVLDAPLCISKRQTLCGGGVLSRQLLMFWAGNGEEAKRHVLRVCNGVGYWRGPNTQAEVSKLITP